MRGERWVWVSIGNEVVIIDRFRPNFAYRVTLGADFRTLTTSYTISHLKVDVDVYYMLHSYKK